MKYQLVGETMQKKYRVLTEQGDYCAHYVVDGGYAWLYVGNSSIPVGAIEKPKFYPEEGCIQEFQAVLATRQSQPNFKVLSDEEGVLTVGTNGGLKDRKDDEKPAPMDTFTVRITEALLGPLGGVIEFIKADFSSNSVKFIEG